MWQACPWAMVRDGEECVCIGGRRGHRTAEMADRVIENSHILRKAGGTGSSEGEGQRSGRNIKPEELKDTENKGMWTLEQFQGRAGDRHYVVRI